MREAKLRHTIAMFVLTITQRDTATAGDRVEELLPRLHGLTTEHAFRRSWGTELVGATLEADAAVAAALTALRQGERGARRWAVGLGVGRVDVEPDGVLAGPGPSRSRRALERCLKAAVPIAVEAGPAGVGFEGVPPAPDSAAAAEGVLRLLGELVASRTEAEWAVLDLLVPGVRGQQKAVAESLGVTVQAVSQAISRARWTQEWEARPAARLLLGLAAFAVD